MVTTGMRSRLHAWKPLALVAALVFVPIAVIGAVHRPFPADTTPTGAYMRVAQSVSKDDPKAFFAYLETEAQWACFTIHDMRAKASARIARSYPEPRRSEMLAQYRALAEAPDGSDAFVVLYRERGWARRLRKDLSGVAKVEVMGERASVVTAQGTRWPFRRRDNGIWGLTVFTAELLADAEKATRDLAVVNAAADDYDRASAR
ncbi:MAG: hypothetical protein JWP97_2717 [Labilithrix sp.]|nr:hypothetical protein [Labilithrix sp.]